MPRSGVSTHFFGANRAIAVEALRKYIMGGHIENGSERRIKMRIGNFTVVAENDKPGYRKKSVTLAMRTKYNPAAFTSRERCLCYYSAGPGGNLRKKRTY